LHILAIIDPPIFVLVPVLVIVPCAGHGPDFEHDHRLGEPIAA
jgi:hypothetical protein